MRKTRLALPLKLADQIAAYVLACPTPPGAGAGQAFDRALSLNPRQNRSLIEQGLLHFDASEFELARQLDERLNQFNNWSARRLLLCGLVASHFSQAGRAEDCQTALEQRYPTSDEAARLASQARKAR